MGAIVGAFDFDRRDLFSFREQKIDLHMIFAVFAVAAGIEIELVTVSPEHLRHDVFHEHPLVDIEFIKEDRFIQFAARRKAVQKRLRHEKPGVGKIAFLRRLILAQREPCARIGRVETGVDEIRFHGGVWRRPA